MIQYTDIQQYIEAGLTDQEIADALRASGGKLQRIIKVRCCDGA